MKSAQRAETSSAPPSLGQRAKASRASAKRLTAPSAVETPDPILPRIEEAYRLLRSSDEAFSA